MVLTTKHTPEKQLKTLKTIKELNADEKILRVVPLQLQGIIKSPSIPPRSSVYATGTRKTTRSHFIVLKSTYLNPNHPNYKTGPKILMLLPIVVLP